MLRYWYGETNNTLWYAYNSNTNVLPETNNGKNGTSCTISRVFDVDADYSKAGEYCQIAVDKAGGVHIAAYDSTHLNLVYAYSPTSEIAASTTTSGFTQCVVDSYGVVGSNISLDVAVTETTENETTTTKAYPYIGYYISSCVAPKYAYLPDGISSTADVTDGAVSDKFTGKWECTVVPTSSTMDMTSKQFDHINVCSWKNTTGVLKTTVSHNSTENTDHYAAGTSFDKESYRKSVYGNGTVNPVLGYKVLHGGGNSVETAQMK